MRIKLRAGNRQPSTNTKTKLDLTKSISDFLKPSDALQIYEINLNLQTISVFFLQFHFFFYHFCTFDSKKWSKMVIAAIASTIGTALGSTHGS